MRNLKFTELGYAPMEVLEASRAVQAQEAERPKPRENGRYYCLSFYLDSITKENWADFLRKLSDFQLTATIHMEVEGRKVRFIIESDRHLENGNSIFYPFRAMPTKEEPARMPRGIWPHAVRSKDLFAFMSREQIRKNREVKRVELKCVIKRPLNVIPAMGGVSYSNGDSEFLAIADLTTFLSFDLLKTAEMHVDKVETELRNSDIRTRRAGRNLMLEGNGVSLGVEDYDFQKHGLVVGQSGAGKSKLLELFVKGLIKSGKLDEYTVVFLDPHGDVHKNIKYAKGTLVDFRSHAIELFSNSGEPSGSTELTVALFSSFIDVSNPYLSRVLKHSLHLLFSLKMMSLDNLSLLLTDTMARKEIVAKSDNVQLKKFFDTEFMEMRTQRYDSSILPIVNLIDEYRMLTAGISEASQHELAGLMDKNPLVFVSTNPALLGKNMTRLIGGAVIQQVFTLLQTGRIRKKIILIVDETSLVQNPALASILSEARKFGLTILFAQQYLGQLEEGVLKSVQANMVNLFCFKVAREDADTVNKMMNLEINPVFEKERAFAKVEDMKTDMLTKSNPRECVFRVMQNGRLVRPVKVRTVDVESLVI
ncbi:MAG: DUF87 domain-containing protein [Candidatus ainarchaeum sp.]|nr:DUF87 domain-containing protein [Candidatus ainarchaeum sp.]